MKPIWLATLTAGLLASTSFASDPEDAKGSRPVDVTGVPAHSRGFIPDDVADPAFDRYVDIRLAGKAWIDGDAALLTDVALQLAEGERILMRPHKALPAEKLLGSAARLATEKKDRGSLERISKAAGKLGQEALAAQVNATLKLPVEARNINPATLLAVESTSMAAFTAYANYLKDIETARIHADRDELDKMEKELDALILLPKEKVDYLRSQLAAARKALPSDAGKDLIAGKLDKLAVASRGWFKDATGIETPKPIQNIGFRDLRNDPSSYYYLSDTPQYQPPQPKPQPKPQPQYRPPQQDTVFVPNASAFTQEGEMRAGSNGVQVFRGGRWVKASAAEEAGYYRKQRQSILYKR